MAKGRRFGELLYYGSYCKDVFHCTVDTCEKAFLEASVNDFIIQCKLLQTLGYDLVVGVSYGRSESDREEICGVVIITTFEDQLYPSFAPVLWKLSVPQEVFLRRELLGSGVSKASF